MIAVYDGTKWVPLGEEGEPGVTNHGMLDGLNTPGDDDHPQYLNKARGDAAYAPINHTHPTIISDARYTHTQSTLAITWTVNHNLGKRPAVSVADGAGTVVFAEVRYIDNNSLELAFTNTATGTAYCN